MLLARSPSIIMLLSFQKKKGFAKNNNIWLSIGVGVAGVSILCTATGKEDRSEGWANMFVIY
jgi:hypothetical protein